MANQTQIYFDTLNRELQEEEEGSRIEREHEAREKQERAKIKREGELMQFRLPSPVPLRGGQPLL